LLAELAGIRILNLDGLAKFLELEQAIEAGHWYDLILLTEYF
jgi:hypothetical protein